MSKWSRTRSLLFLAAASVYPVGALLADQANGTSRAAPVAPDVVVADELAGPIETLPVGPAPEQRDGGTSRVSVSDAGTVEIHVSEANLVEVLRMLSMQSQKNIIASRNVRGTVTANLYDVTIPEALDAILHANGFGYRERGNFIYVYTEAELREIERNERQTTSEVFRLFYTPSANAVNMIKPVLSADAQVSFSAAAATGIAAGGSDTGGNTHASGDVLVVRDYPENLERVRLVLQEVDRRPQQILVEATIISARLSENNALGIDFTITGGINFNEIRHVNGLFQSAGLGDSFSTPATSVGTGNNFTRGINGFNVGIVGSNVAMFLAALEEISDTTVLANPKVMTLNRQRGEVLIGREDGYLTTTVTDTTTVQTVEFLQTGTRLIFRPFVADDGYIRMEVHPEDSDGTVINGLPAKTTTQVTTNVLVRDGHTIVIGGLFRESNVTGRNQVPVLGNLPVVGPLFRNQTDSTRREEIIILLTPHIVKDHSAYAAASEAELRDMERLRVGVRRGMMPTGRERLAEGYYDRAVAEMNKAEPDTERAVWFLNCATNLNPKFLEAIRMKEQLTGRQVSTVDNSSIRHFVQQQIMAERAAGGPQAASTPRSFRLPAPTQVSGRSSTPSFTEEAPVAQNEEAPAQPQQPQQPEQPSGAVATVEDEPAVQEEAVVEQQPQPDPDAMADAQVELLEDTQAAGDAEPADQQADTVEPKLDMSITELDIIDLLPSGGDK